MKRFSESHEANPAEMDAHSPRADATPSNPYAPENMLLRSRRQFPDHENCCLEGVSGPKRWYAHYGWIFGFIDLSRRLHFFEMDLDPRRSGASLDPSVRAYLNAPAARRRLMADLGR